MAHLITDLCTGCTACAKVCPTGAITGARNQLHVIDPRRCIDCGMCGKVCPPAAIRDPRGATLALLKKSLWQKPVVDRALCMACDVCIQVCPVSCLGRADPTDKDPNAYPYLSEPKRCIACKFCEEECPVGAIVMA